MRVSCLPLSVEGFLEVYADPVDDRGFRYVHWGGVMSSVKDEHIELSSEDWGWNEWIMAEAAIIKGHISSLSDSGIVKFHLEKDHNYFMFASKDRFHTELPLNDMVKLRLRIRDQERTVDQSREKLHKEEATLELLNETLCNLLSSEGIS